VHSNIKSERKQKERKKRKTSKRRKSRRQEKLKRHAEIMSDEAAAVAAVGKK